MILKLFIFLLPLVFVGCGGAKPSVVDDSMDKSEPVVQKVSVKKLKTKEIKPLVKKPKTEMVWSNSSQFYMNEKEYDTALVKYVELKYPKNVKVYKQKEINIQKEIKRQKNIKRQTQIKKYTVTLNHLMWQDNKEAKTVQKDWYDAKGYCKNINLLGFNDWRLTTKKELETIVDKNRTPTIKKEFNNISSSGYWSSTTDASATGGAWYVSFYDGNSYYGNKSLNGYVRCVRGGQ